MSNPLPYPAGGSPAMPAASLPYPVAGQMPQPQVPVSGALGSALPGQPIPGALSATSAGGVVFQPSPQEIQQKKMVVQYSTGADVYRRPIDNTTTPGWRSCVFSEKNMFRQIEASGKTKDHKIKDHKDKDKSNKDNKDSKDHKAHGDQKTVTPAQTNENAGKKVYLARNAGTDVGQIEWRFDVSKSACRIKKLRVKFETKVFGDGVVKAHIVTGTGQRIDFNTSGDKEKDYKFKELTGCQTFSIVAELLSDPTGASMSLKNKEKKDKKEKDKNKLGTPAAPRAPFQNARLFNQGLGDASPLFEVEMAFE